MALAPPQNVQITGPGAGVTGPANIALAGTTSSVQVVLAGATTTNNLTINAQFVDTVTMTGIGTPGVQDSVTNGATPVTAVTAPASGHTRSVTGLVVTNLDTVSAVVTVNLDIATVLTPQIVAPLAPGQALVMVPSGTGWAVTSPLISSGGGGSSSTGRGALTDASGTVTAGGAAQTALTANANRRYLLIQNCDNVDLWVNFGVVAIVGQPSVCLAAASSSPSQGGTLVFSTDYIPTGYVSVIGATTGKQFVIKWA